jgi:DHA1 family multidrug resistance protein-like MFS transporter
MLGAAMPLASYPLFHNLGIDWGNTLLGFVSLVFLPIPYVLFPLLTRPQNYGLAGLDA